MYKARKDQQILRLVFKVLQAHKARQVRKEPKVFKVQLARKALEGYQAFKELKDRQALKGFRAPKVFKGRQGLQGYKVSRVLQARPELRAQLGLQELLVLLVHPAQPVYKGSQVLQVPLARRGPPALAERKGLLAHKV